MRTLLLLCLLLMVTASCGSPERKSSVETPETPAADSIQVAPSDTSATVY